MIWVPVQSEPDIDFFKNLCYFWIRSRYYKWRAYHLYQRRSHYYLYWVPVQREQDIDFLKNLCHFWKRSRNCKRRVYHIYQRKNHYNLYWVPAQSEGHLLYCKWKKSKDLRLFFCTQIPYLETPYFNANKAKKNKLS